MANDLTKRPRDDIIQEGDMIELVRFSPPSSSRSSEASGRRKKKFKNKIGSPPAASPVEPRGAGGDDLFFVRPRRTLPPVTHRGKKKVAAPEPATTTDATTDDSSGSLSDLDLGARRRSETTTTTSRSSTYRNRIRERFRSVRRQAGRSCDGAKPVERVFDVDEIGGRSRDEAGDVAREDVCNFFCEGRGALGSDGDGAVVEAVLPESLRFNVEMSERDCLWIPRGKAIELEDKTITGELHFLSEEGFYVAEKPNVADSHLNLLEERLITAGDKKWFNSEGTLATVRDPWSKTSLRPICASTPEGRNADKELTFYATPSLAPGDDCEEVVVVGDDTLLLHVGAVRFQHHPLFSREHVLERRLVALHGEYEKQNAVDRFQRIRLRLEALRRSRRGLAKASGDCRVEDDAEEIRALRESLFEEGKKRREVLKDILKVWKAIKKLRAAQGYSNTDVKLLIRKEERPDPDAERRLYEEAKREALEEVLAEREKEHKDKVAAYRRAALAWKDRKDEAGERPAKPQRDFDEETLRDEINRRFEESFKPPEEPIVRFALSRENEIAEDVEDAREKLRRDAVSATKVYLKISCDGIEVCKSKAVLLDDRFECVFDESFAIKPTATPDALSVQIFEKPGALVKRSPGEVQIKPPKPGRGRRQPTAKAFRREEIVHYKHAGVGSGIPSDKGEVLNTCGTVSCEISWESNRASDEGLCETAAVWEGFLDERTGGIDLEKLRGWVERSNPDPMDPRNAVIFDYLGRFESVPDCKTTTETRRCFRLNPYARRLDFCEAGKIENNLRFRMLELRDKNEPEFVGAVVPNRLKEIPANVLSAYKRRLAEENGDLLLRHDFESGHVDDRLAFGRKFLRQVHTKVFQRCRCARNNLRFEDVVDEKYLAHFALFVETLVANLVNWFRLRPGVGKPLPKIATGRRPAEKTETTAVSGGEGRIVVRVVSAANLIGKSNGEESRPLVSVGYRELSVETRAVSRREHVVWDEKLILPLESSHTDYLNPDSLNGSVSVCLFDETGGDAMESRRNWLGSVEIPVSAICHGGKMEGMFRVNSPAMILGYGTVNEERGLSRSGTTSSSPSSAYLNLEIAVEPSVIPKLHASMDELDCNEPPYLREHILRWNEGYNADFPARRFSSLVIDIDGRTNCATRYIRALEPPPQTNAYDLSAEHCAAYVSLIPFSERNHFYQNIWLTTDQMLKISTGTVVDHAVALTCYLTALNLDVWLALGFGIPHGSAAFVLLREFRRDAQLPSYCVYDVVTATKHDVTDPLCPLRTVYCVINEHNIWANLQRNDRIATTRFDFTRRSDWLRLFSDRRVPAPTSSVQTKLVYVSSEAASSAEIEDLLYKRIRKRLTKMRKMGGGGATRFERRTSVEVEGRLRNVEAARANGRSALEASSKELRRGFNVRNPDGYLVHFPYGGVKKLLDDLTPLLGVYASEKSTDYALAIAATVYPNSVTSVWIFLAEVQR